MCKLGDIIVVKNYIGDDGKKISQHSFVVINDKPDFIEGLNYDFVANVMSSFKSEEQRIKKLRFEENLEVVSNDMISKLPKNKKSGFIKADQLVPRTATATGSRPPARTCAHGPSATRSTTSTVCCLPPGPAGC